MLSVEEFQAFPASQREAPPMLARWQQRPCASLGQVTSRRMRAAARRFLRPQIRQGPPLLAPLVLGGSRVDSASRLLLACLLRRIAPAVHHATGNDEKRTLVKTRMVGLRAKEPVSAQNCRAPSLVRQIHPPECPHTYR